MLNKKQLLLLLLSHHPPFQNNRTLRIKLPCGELRLCARCSGGVIGLVTGLLVFRWWPSWPLWFMLILTVLFPLAGIVDWTSQALGKRESHNLLRVLTGAMFSLTCLVIGRFLTMGKVHLFALAILLLTAEIEIALLFLYKKQVIESILAPLREYAESLLIPKPQNGEGDP